MHPFYLSILCLLCCCQLIESFSTLKKYHTHSKSRNYRFVANAPTNHQSSALFDINDMNDTTHLIANGDSHSNNHSNDRKSNSSNMIEKIWKKMNGLLDSYSNSLEKHPYLVKIISSAVIGGLGDILIQFYQSKISNAITFTFDLRRFIVFTTVAGFYIAPVINLWFNWLARLPVPTKWNNVAKAAYMMLIDQTAGAVLINMGFFFAFELAQRAFPPYNVFTSNFIDAGILSTKNNLWETLIANWYCWPWINFINFLWVPLKYRVLFSNAAAVLWNMFLSSIANRAIVN